MQEQIKGLSKPRPLADPMLIISLVAIGGGIVDVVIGLLTHDAVTLSLGVTFGFGFALLTVPLRRPNAIYLRAFKTDKSTAKLRNRLTAILGSGYRLAGIRPPRERSGNVFRFIFPVVLALRYAGSKYMELEAGDDWMQRLWVTYRKVRIVFIDIRETTLYVHQEIQMTLYALGPSRCVFLVDLEKNSSASWLLELAEILGPHFAPDALQLVDVSNIAQSSGLMSASLKRIVAVLPPKLTSDTNDGWQFTLDHSRPELFQTALREKQKSIFLLVVKYAIIVVASMASYYCLSRWIILNFDSTVGSLGLYGFLAVEAVVISAFLILIVNAIIRALRAGWLLLVERHLSAAVLSFALLILALFSITRAPLYFYRLHRLSEDVQREEEARKFQAIIYANGGATAFRSDTLHLTYTYPGQLLNYTQNTARQLGTRHDSGYYSGPYKGCTSIPFNGISFFPDGYREILIRAFDINCMKKLPTQSLLDEVLLSTRGDAEMAAEPSPRPIHYELSGHQAAGLQAVIVTPSDLETPALLIPDPKRGTTMETIGDAYVPSYHSTACILIGTSVVCWTFKAQRCQSFTYMQYLPVQFDGQPAEEVLPAQFAPACPPKNDS